MPNIVRGEELCERVCAHVYFSARCTCIVVCVCVRVCVCVCVCVCVHETDFTL